MIVGVNHHSMSRLDLDFKNLKWAYGWWSGGSIIFPYPSLDLHYKILSELLVADLGSQSSFNVQAGSSLYNFKWASDCWSGTLKDDWPPTTTNSYHWPVSGTISKLRVSMTIKRWLTPCITDHSLRYNFKVKELAWALKDDWTPQYHWPVSGTILKSKS